MIHMDNYNFSDCLPVFFVSFILHCFMQILGENENLFQIVSLSASDCTY